MNETTDGFAVITGASQGLGRAFAEEMAGRGKSCILIALPDTGLPELKRILELAHGVRMEAVEMDLTGADAPERLAARIEERGFEVDFLVNNAGVAFNGRFEDNTLAQAETQIRLNVLSLVKLTHLLLPLLKRQPRSRVLNVASMAAYFPMPRMPIYSPSKSFVLGFSLALREELRGTPVSVSVLCPNGIRTNRQCRALIDRQGLAGRITCRYPDEVAREALRGCLRGRAIIVPGIVNRMLRIAGTLLPRTLYMRIIADRWGRAEYTPKNASKLSLAGAR